MNTLLRSTLYAMLVWWCVGWPLIAIQQHAKATDMGLSRDLHRAAYHECMGGVSSLEGHIARAEVHQAYMIQALERGFGVEVGR